MSRIGKKPIKLPKNVSINNDGIDLIVKGKFGILRKQIPDIIDIKYQDHILYLTLKKNKIRKSSALYGLYRTLINNMVIGVSEQFKIVLKLNGIGYKANIEKKLIVLHLGYSHTIVKNIPDEIFVEILQNTTLILKSCDKEKLGLFASQIRSHRPPEPYKGKGVLFENEIIKCKSGKSNKK